MAERGALVLRVLAMIKYKADFNEIQRTQFSPTKLCLYLIFVFALIVVVSCAEEKASFRLSNADTASSADIACAIKQFPLEPTHFVASKQNGVGMIRFYDQIHDRYHSNGVLITLSLEDANTGQSCSALDAIVGQDLETAPLACVQVQVILGKCKGVALNLHMLGSIQFSSLNFSRSKRINASLAGELYHVQFLGTNKEEKKLTKIGALEGEFDFEVQSGSQYQIFDRPYQ